MDSRLYRVLIGVEERLRRMYFTISGSADVLRCHVQNCVLPQNLYMLNNVAVQNPEYEITTASTVPHGHSLEKNAADVDATHNDRPLIKQESACDVSL